MKPVAPQWLAGLSCLLLGLAATATAADGEDPPPSEELLEFLALWEPEDDAWLGAALAETGDERGDEQDVPESTETENDED